MKLALTALVVLACSSASAAPTAWGQPMPEHCTTTFEWKSPNTLPVHVYADATCAKPWATNAATFWKGLAALLAAPDTRPQP